VKTVVAKKFELQSIRISINVYLRKTNRLN